MCKNNNCKFIYSSGYAVCPECGTVDENRKDFSFEKARKIVNNEIDELVKKFPKCKKIASPLSNAIRRSNKICIELPFKPNLAAPIEYSINNFHIKLSKKLIHKEYLDFKKSYVKTFGKAVNDELCMLSALIFVIVLREYNYISLDEIVLGVTNPKKVNKMSTLHRTKQYLMKYKQLYNVPSIYGDWNNFQRELAMKVINYYYDDIEIANATGELAFKINKNMVPSPVFAAFTAVIIIDSYNFNKISFGELKKEYGIRQSTLTKYIEIVGRALAKNKTPVISKYERISKRGRKRRVSMPT